MTDVVAPAAVAADERAAFCAVHLGPLVGALGLFVRDASLGEELAQEALLRACERWEEVRHLERPAAWLYRVGTNLARSRARRTVARARALARHGPSPTVVEPGSEDALLVRAALRRLPDHHRQVLVLRHVAGLSVADTAAVLGISETAVTSRASRAAAALRELLEER